MARKYDDIPVLLSLASRRRTLRALKKIQLSPAMSADDAVSEVAAAVGKPIFLESTVDERFRTTTGSFAVTPEFILVVFRGLDPHSYQMHSLFHELGHLLSGHTHCRRPATAPDAEASDQLFWNDSEREAEFIAYKMAAVISRKPASSQAFG